MKAYWVVRGNILNQEEYSKYIDLAGPIIHKHKGKFHSKRRATNRGRGRGFRKNGINRI